MQLLLSALALVSPLTVASAERGLDVDLTGFESAVEQPSGSGGVEGAWSARLGEHELTLELWFGAVANYRFSEPVDVVKILDDSQRQQGTYALDGQGPLEGSFGYASYAWLGEFRRVPDATSARRFVLGGLLETEGYALVADCRPAPDAETRRTLIGLLESAITYTGPTRDANWTDAELEARWQRDAPKRVLEQDEPGFIRTKHYVILTNMRAKGGTAKKFGKKMEQCYSEIRKVFPFPEVEGERLMPVYLFKTVGQYQLFLQETLGQTPEQSQRSAGVAFSDVYVTSYAAPNDPVHIHEATHQIFGNRLRLRGGGSWFQEGVAEYIELESNQRKLFRKVAGKGRHAPFTKFMQMPSLLYSSEESVKGGNEAGDLYLQAACVVEFARESKWGKSHFESFIAEVGRVPRSNLEQIEAALQRVYGVGIAGFEEEFVKYWKKR